MSKRGRITVAVLAAILSGLAWLLVSSLPAREPVYEGKPLSRWLAGASRRDARRAVRACGTNAIPTLVRMLRATDSPLKLKLVQLAGKQHFIKFHWRMAGVLHEEAIRALLEMGPRVEFAMPELVKLYDEAPASPLFTPSWFLKEQIAQLFVGLGPAAKDAEPSLRRDAASGTNSTRTVLDALRCVDGKEPLPWEQGNQPRFSHSLDLVEQIHKSLPFPGPTTRAKPLVPELLAMRDKPGPDGYWARFALQEIDPDTAERVLTNSRPVVEPPPTTTSGPETATPETEPEVDAVAFLSGPRPIIQPPAATTPILEAGTDTPPLTVGDWSEAAGPPKRRTLRGRLLASWPSDRRNNSRGGSPRIEMELQHLALSPDGLPFTVYFDPGQSLQCELRDARGALVPSLPASQSPAPRSCWITVPFDGEVKFPLDPGNPSSPSGSDGLTIQLGRRAWHIPARDTNLFFLSGTFTPTTNRVHPLGYPVWAGTFKLPAVAISAGRP
jgi:hypothetical protein